MARYDYACLSCFHRFEVQHAPHEAPLVSCAQCGGLAEKVLNPASVILHRSSSSTTDVEPHEKEGCNHSGCAWHRPLSDWA